MTGVPDSREPDHRLHDHAVVARVRHRDIQAPCAFAVEGCLVDLIKFFALPGMQSFGHPCRMFIVRAPAEPSGSRAGRLRRRRACEAGRLPTTRSARYEPLKADMAAPPCYFTKWTQIRRARLITRSRARSLRRRCDRRRRPTHDRMQATCHMIV